MKHYRLLAYIRHLSKKLDALQSLIHKTQPKPPSRIQLIHKTQPKPPSHVQLVQIIGNVEASRSLTRARQQVALCILALSQLTVNQLLLLTVRDYCHILSNLPHLTYDTVYIAWIQNCKLTLCRPCRSSLRMCPMILSRSAPRRTRSVPAHDLRS